MILNRKMIGSITIKKRELYLLQYDSNNLTKQTINDENSAWSISMLSSSFLITDLAKSNECKFSHGVSQAGPNLHPLDFTKLYPFQ